MAKIKVAKPIVELDGDEMTKDLALLIGPEQQWLTTEGLLEAVAANLGKAME